MKSTLQRKTREAGEIMRFVTPILVTVALYVLADIRARVDTLADLIPKVAALEARVHIIERNGDEK